MNRKHTKSSNGFTKEVVLPGANRPWMVLVILLMTLCSIQAGAQGLNLEWGNSLPGKGNEYGYGVAFDAAGNVYVTGTFSDTLDCDPGPGTANLVPASLSSGPLNQNIFIAKYDADGNYLWAKAIVGNDVNFWGVAKQLAVDSAGNLIVTGILLDSTDFDPGPGTAILTSSGSMDIFIAKYDTDGNYMWAEKTGGIAGEWPSGVALDAAGNIYISGTFTDSADFDPGPGNATIISAGGQDNFVAKYDGAGNYLWAHRMGTVAYGPAENGNGVAVDAGGNVITTGAFANIATFSSTTTTLTSAGGRDAYILKQDSAGNFAWAISIGGAGGDDYGYDVAVDKAGNIYAAGYFQGQVDFDPGPGTASLTSNSMFDAYLAKYDPDGNYLWAIHVGDGYLNTFTSVGTDVIGNVYVSGFFMGTPDFDPGPGTALLTSSGGLNAVIAKYDALNGGYLWAGTLESIGSNFANPLAIDASGTTYVTGAFAGPADLDPGPGTAIHTPASADLNDVFLLKLACGDTTTTQLHVVACDSSYTLNGETYTSTGVYIQHLANASHCDSTIVLDVTFTPLEAPFITVNTFLLGTTQSYASYQWIKNGTPIPGATNSTLNVTENGDYQVTVINGEGCSATSAIYTVTNVTSVNDPEGIGNQIRVYPNPATDKIMISSPVEVNATILSMDGRHILYVENAGEVSLKGLADGIYLLRFTDKKGRIIKYEKVVKQL